MARIFYDTEFIEDGKTIDLISIGMVKDIDIGNGVVETYYAVSSEFDPSKASDWVKENVLAKLNTEEAKTRKQIAQEIKHFVWYKPEFWAYFADYDHVVLCQLYGTMVDLPEGWPYYTRDLKQWMDELGIEKDKLPPEDLTTEHNALADALWVARAYAAMEKSSGRL